MSLSYTFSLATRLALATYVTSLAHGAFCAPIQQREYSFNAVRPDPAADGLSAQNGQAQGVLYYSPAAVDSDHAESSASRSPGSTSVTATFLPMGNADSVTDPVPSAPSAAQMSSSRMSDPTTTSSYATSSQSTGFAMQQASSVVSSSTVSSVTPTASLGAQGGLPNESSGPHNGSLVMAYYTDWSGYTLPPEKVNFSKFDVVDFAFAMPNEKFALSWDDPNASPALLRRLVSSASKAGAKVILSVGGWSGSKYFSPAVATLAARQAFVSNIAAAYKDFGLQGIDIDWEYPGHQGSGGNMVSPQDSRNFLSFLQLLRSTLPVDALITAAVTTTPFVDEKQAPLSDVSDFAEVLDWITIMNYDVWQSSSKPGPNAPLSDYCNNSTQPQANAVEAYKAWTSAGFPAEKLVLGVASYGYKSTSDANQLRTRSSFTSSSAISARDDDGGQVLFKTLLKQGKIVKSSTVSNDTVSDADFTGGSDVSSPISAGSDYIQGWDSCSSTPYIYSPSKHEVVTYDDPVSLTMKAEWVKAVGMKGVDFWEMDGDSEEWDLTDAVRAAFGRS